jgi:hypothetical protein
MARQQELLRHAVAYFLRPEPTPGRFSHCCTALTAGIATLVAMVERGDRCTISHAAVRS